MELSELKIGDLLAVRGKGLISEAIEDICKSPYSHIAGYVGNNQLIEAEGFRRTGYAPVSKYAGIADVYRCDTATPEQLRQMRQLAIWSIGGHYDYVLLGIELMRYATGVILPYREPPNLRICSVLWTGIYRDVGLNLWPKIRYPTPSDVPGPLRKIGSV